MLVKFQSTHPRGVRRAFAMSSNTPIGVLIHAPAGGATAFSAAIATTLSCFNPRTRGGCD